jgi:hypothetical protein
MAKAKVKSVEDVVVEEVVEELVEEVVEELPHPNPIIQMAIDQAKERLLKENGK